VPDGLWKNLLSGIKKNWEGAGGAVPKIELWVMIRTGD